MRLLVVEDEDKMRSLLRRGLESAGYAVDEAPDGRSGLARGLEGGYDALVLDILLPDIDGFEVCRQLRRAEVWTPVLMLTALDAVEDRIMGLDVGADDYLVKPFALGELLSRLRALIRRGRPPRPSILSCGPLQLDPATRQVSWGGEPVVLSRREFALLEFLLHHRNEVVQRTTILRHVWGVRSDEQSNIIDAFVRNLRQKLDRRFDHPLIETVRGVGFRLRCPEEE
ncbi:MAG TPA: response regulator transcription factor [Actinomycetota bacterium]|nr:response regulator transcription factor [Actinomycetota bacterium]